LEALLMRASCCPDIDRLFDQETTEGLPVQDLHPHGGMLKGFVMGAGDKPFFWYRSGRLSPVGRTAYDLREVV
jgi:hypothetical protein